MNAICALCTGRQKDITKESDGLYNHSTRLTIVLLFQLSFVFIHMSYNRGAPNIQSGAPIFTGKSILKSPKTDWFMNTPRQFLWAPDN